MEIQAGGLKITLPDTIPTMTHDEWIAEGKRRFGDNFDDWKFVCPICKNVASVWDYKPFKDKGATPDSAVKECIGRYTGTGREAFGDAPKGVSQPCDYAIYGLFRIPGVVVVFPDGTQSMAFAFAEATS